MPVKPQTPEPLKAQAFEPPWLVGTISAVAGAREYAARKPAERAADMVELRLDQIPESDWDAVFQACDQLEAAGTNVLSTIRLPSDGGAWHGEDQARKAGFTRALEHSSWVDVEASSAIAPWLCAEARKLGKRSIVSVHDFAKTPAPAELEKLYAEGLQLGADVVKIATMVATGEDHVALVSLVAKHAARKNLCALGMGAFGLSLRVYLPVIGSVFAYAYVDRQAAPGQLSCTQMSELLRLQIPRFHERQLERSA